MTINKENDGNSSSSKNQSTQIAIITDNTATSANNSSMLISDENTITIENDTSRHNIENTSEKSRFDSQETIVVLPPEQHDQETTTQQTCNYNFFSRISHQRKNFGYLILFIVFGLCIGSIIEKSIN
ncbi:11554_t:CDS:2 [Ambispora gerdemannii]|uniref:11554_t:CDS:1 n=1 Tax=Ambispora gerdemannii TaxID=144530 RepID=A0A9N8YZT3_9GLOM|nr:11554_t:CDS:2 [Ambispora gerdemannii]